MKRSVTYFLKKLFPLLFIALFFNSCYYDNLEEIHPFLPTANCDTTGTISYSTDLVPILVSYCSLNSPTCHNAATSYPMDTYDGVAVFAQSGVLVQSIKHDPAIVGGPINYMPSGGGKLDRCSIMKIEAWVNRGFPQN
jgi:hypothetical protein